MYNDDVLRGEKYIHTHIQKKILVSAWIPTQDLNTSQTLSLLCHLGPWAEERKTSHISKIA